MPFAIDNNRSGKTLGVHFKPGGACALLPIAMREMNNQLVSLESVIGTRAGFRLQPPSL
ncbi:MAG: hypothetical protein O3A63_20710 [Proteobacteria bacterium]|nr:hypothetical protein [Pseudomonadota bacterium]